MKTEYRRDLQNNYLVLEVPGENEEEDYGLRMVQQNQIKGLLPVHVSGMDGKRYLNYEITSRQTLESLYEKKAMGYQDILLIFSDIYDTLEEMRKYLLSWRRLLFAPELIYVLPERRGLLLCYYTKEDEYPVTALAEYILKRLDHRDRQAVVLGYGFYQQISETNFSLTKTLKEILAGEREKECGRQRAPAGREAQDGIKGHGGQQAPTGRDRQDAINEYGQRKIIGGKDIPYDYEVRDDERPGRDNPENEECGIYRSPDQRPNQNRKRDQDLADWLFSKVHPAVMLTFLLCMVIFELLIVFDVLGIREAGGCFFLVLSGEVLINRRILHKNNSETEECEEEEENEEYQKILQEVYQAEPEPETDHEPLEETCYLNPEEGGEKLSLVCISSRLDGREKPGKHTCPPGSDASGRNSGCPPGSDVYGTNFAAGSEKFPDIYPGKTPLYIGKIQGEADILLNVSTVSRMHARLEMRENVCYLRDLNSKNGTFLNGRRLQPQEECELQPEDTVAFAEVKYQVVMRH